MNRERAKQLGAVIALAALGLGGGAGMRAWRATHGAGAGNASGDGRVFAGAKLSPAATGAWNKLLAALGLHGAKTFSTADLVALLSGHDTDPEALAFAAEFRRDPQLMEIWAQYERENDLAWLARRLSDSRAFTELLNRHADDPRFIAVANLLAGELDSSLAYRRNQGDPGQGLAVNRPLHPSGAAKETGPVAGKGAVGWQPPVLAALGPKGSSPVQAGAGPELFAAVQTAPEKDGQRGVQDAKTQAAGQEHRVDWKLKDTVSKAGPDKDILHYLESLFKSMAKSDRDYLIDQCAGHGNCDPTVACNASAALWESCTRACKANPRCTIQFPPDRPAPNPCADPESRSCAQFCSANPGGPGCISHALTPSDGEPSGADDHAQPDGTPEGGPPQGSNGLTGQQLIEKCTGGDMPSCRQVCNGNPFIMLADYCAGVRAENHEADCQRLPCNPGCPNFSSATCKCQREPCSPGCSNAPSWCGGSGRN
ncbi:MAG: hypothetical protein HY925_13795 [Elusimicrobia bacterium]|nr:hypothetical protein [Elusimicrobiota bacterium]